MRIQLLNPYSLLILLYLDHLHRHKVNFGLFRNLYHLVLCGHISHVLELGYVKQHTDCIVEIDPVELGMVSDRVVNIHKLPHVAKLVYG